MGTMYKHFQIQLSDVSLLIFASLHVVKIMRTREIEASPSDFGIKASVVILRADKKTSC